MTGSGADRLALTDLVFTVTEELENHTETCVRNQTIRCEGCGAWVLDDGGVPDLDRHRTEVVIRMVSDRIADDMRGSGVDPPLVPLVAERARRYAEAVRSRG